jgi:NADH-quinone oxidoreductase subunit M
VQFNLFVGLGVVVAAALNGIAVLRAYFLLFTGARHASTVSLAIGLRERIAVLTLVLVVVAGGLFPQPGVATRQRAAADLLAERETRTTSRGQESGNRSQQEAAVRLLTPDP